MQSSVELPIFPTWGNCGKIKAWAGSMNPDGWRMRSFFTEDYDEAEDDL